MKTVKTQLKQLAAISALGTLLVMPTIAFAEEPVAPGTTVNTIALTSAQVTVRDSSGQTVATSPVISSDASGTASAVVPVATDNTLATNTTATVAVDSNASDNSATVGVTGNGSTDTAMPEDKTLLERMGDKTKSAYDTAKDKTKSAYHTVKDKTKQAANKVGEEAKEAKDAIKDKLTPDTPASDVPAATPADVDHQNHN